ncbi:glutathione S-transferase family protein [uncultured Sphingomonas sp.]|uniref:glutathione S-transferase family protein n=1 Tax=uncultured Sphingomonas sp. TaxID=158754 RepID=UPI002631E95D|nr:glutathione S-transferase family protein [uncultured Sphingomonas sp.]
MAFTLYEHPLSSYCQKAKTAFYEKDIPFESRMLDGSEPVASDFAALWPIGKFPALTHGDRFVFDATGIIEYLDALHPRSAPLLPADPVAAAEARMMDRFFDNYVNYPQQRIVVGRIGRDDATREPQWRAALERAYAWLEKRLAGREWAVGQGFTLADCAAAPALLYADWTHAIPRDHGALHAYRARLLTRASYARALDEARPYRHMFPLGAPEGRD